MASSTTNWTATYRFSELRGRPVSWRVASARPGVLRDLVLVAMGGDLRARLLIVASARSGPTWYVPWSSVIAVERDRLLAHADPRATAEPPPEAPMVRIDRDLLSCPVVDGDGKRLGAVQDVRLAASHGELSLVELEVGFVPAIVARLAPNLLTRIVAWDDVVPSSLPGPTRASRRLVLSTVKI